MFAYGFVDDDPSGARSTASRSCASPCRSSPAPATSGSSPPSACSRASSASTPRPAPPRSPILADDSADPDHVAADLVSQAEHDPLAAVGARHRQRGARRGHPAVALARRVPATKHSERVTEALEGTQSRIVLVDDVDAGLDVVNAYAAEHLEIQTRDAADGRRPRAQRRRRLRRSAQRRSASATTPPGPTTCCPPAGCACHSSGLSVQSFLRGIHVVDYDEPALRDVAPPRRHAGPGRGPARPTARP